MPVDKVSPVKALVQEGLYLLMEPLGYTLEGYNLIRKISTCSSTASFFDSD